jgi:hypothetical protein
MMDKRKPVLARKGAPTVVIALGGPKMEKGLTCPKCGAELANTPENRKYAAMRDEEMQDEEMDDEDAA